MLGLAYETAESFGMDEDGELVYDNRKILFTSQELPIEAEQVAQRIPGIRANTTATVSGRGVHPF